MSSPIRYLPVSYLEYNARLSPAGVALYDLDRRVTFSQLLGYVRAAAAALRQRGLQAGDVVGVQLPNVWEYVALELAIPHAGGIILPLPPNLGRHELSSIMQRSVMTYAVIGYDCGADLLSLAPSFPHLRDVLVPSDLLGVESGDPIAEMPDPERVVEIALTSGTTGLPKLAALTALLKQVTFEAFTGRLEIAPTVRVLLMSPVKQGIGGMCLYCLRRGAALVMLHQIHFTPERTLEIAQHSGATFMVGVPTNVTRLLDSPALPRTDLCALRATAVAGAPMPPEV